MKEKIIAFARIAAHKMMAYDDFCCLPMCKQIDKVCELAEEAYTIFVGQGKPTPKMMDEVRKWVFGELNDDDW